MKTILVPIDIPNASENAIDYAVELALQTKAKIILFHSYHVRMLLSSLVLIDGGFEKENKRRLKIIEDEIVRKIGDKKIEIEIIVRNGFAADEIIEIIKKYNIDIIVMGVNGSNKSSKKFIGTTTISVIQKSKIPVLVIPNNAQFKKIEKIVLACDFNTLIPKKEIYELKEFAKNFNAKILIFGVLDPLEIETDNHHISVLNLEDALEDIDHEIIFRSSTNILDEINLFVDTQQGDWLAMVPHSQEFISGVFHESKTNKMVYQSHVPLLSIHE